MLNLLTLDLVFSVSARFVKYFLTQSWVALKKVWDSIIDARMGGGTVPVKRCLVKKY